MTADECTSPNCIFCLKGGLVPDTWDPVLRDSKAVTTAGGRSPGAVQLQDPLQLVAQADPECPSQQLFSPQKWSHHPAQTGADSHSAINPHLKDSWVWG